jgi:AcrR family transcriptional regulator
VGGEDVDVGAGAAGGAAAEAAAGADPPRDTRGGGRRRGGVRRARLDPATRRAQLIDTAVAELDARGLPALGVDDVADAAGVSRSLVYAYFGDRDGLAAEVYVHVLGRLGEHLGPEAPADEADIRRIVVACIDFARANPAAWRLLVSDPARQHALVREARAERATWVSIRWHMAHLEEGPVASTLAGGVLAAEAALGMLESGVLHWLDHPDLPADDAAALLARILWYGLTRHPQPP